MQKATCFLELTKTFIYEVLLKLGGKCVEEKEDPGAAQHSTAVAGEC